MKYLQIQRRLQDLILARKWHFVYEEKVHARVCIGIDFVFLRPRNTSPVMMKLIDQTAFATVLDIS